MYRQWISASVIAFLAAGSSAVSADGSDLIAARIANFREIGTAFKQIKDEMKSKRADPARIRDAAKHIKDRAVEVPLWFPPGTESVAPLEQSWLDRILGWLRLSDSVQLPDEVGSRAKIEVWTQPQQFTAAHRAFKVEADRFWQAAQGGQSADIETRFKALGRTCEGCHKQFREEED